MNVSNSLFRSQHAKKPQPMSPIRSRVMHERSSFATIPNCSEAGGMRIGICPDLLDSFYRIVRASGFSAGIDPSGR